MLLTITPNPAIDRSLFVPHLQIGEVHRATRLHLAAGGKGLNVFRASRILSQKATVTGPLAGFTGTLIASLAETEGIRADWFYLKRGESRNCLLLQQEGRDSTVINEPGFRLDPEEWSAFVEHCRELSSRSEGACVCGSFPPGLTADDAGLLFSALESEHHPLLIDSSGEALKAALERPALIKINQGELIQALGWEGEPDDWKGIQRAGLPRRQTLSALDSRLTALIITLGEQGAVWIERQSLWKAVPPRVPVKSSVGSGDAFSAALLAALLRGFPPQECLRWGVAAGTANLTTDLPARFDSSLFRQLLPKVEVNRISE